MIAELVKDTKTFYKTVAIALVVFVFALTICIVLSVPLPLGSDPYFHLEIARLYGTGNFTGAFNYITTVNMIPFYPPLYHVFLIPSALSPSPLSAIRILEMFSMPLTFAFTAWLLWKASGPKAALIGGLILLGSWSFIDGALQARPEALDLMFYPLMLVALLAVKKKTFAALAVATVYNHGVMAVTNIWGWLIPLLRKREVTNIWIEKKHTLVGLSSKPWLNTVLMVAAISSPVLILTALYFGGGWTMWATTQPQENPQERLFWTTPSWIPFYAGITLLGFFFIRRHPKTELESYLQYGLLGNLVMLPLWADRWLQYSTIPLACLVGMEVSRWHGKKLYLTLSVIAIGAWIYVCFFLFNSATANWWQPGEFVHK